MIYKWHEVNNMTETERHEKKIKRYRLTCTANGINDAFACYGDNFHEADDYLRKRLFDRYGSVIRITKTTITKEF